MGVVGLLAVYDLAGRVLPSRRALFVAVLTAVGPFWMSTTAVFYTDVPAFTLAMVSLALGARALESDDRRGWLLAASFAAGLFGFTVREYVIVAPVAVALVAIWHGGPRVRRIGIVVGLGAVVAACAVFFMWREGLPGFQVQGIAVPDRASVVNTATEVTRTTILVGIFLTPAVLLASPVRIVRDAVRRAPWSTLIVTAGASIALLADVAVEGDRFAAPDYATGTQWTIPGSHESFVPKAVLPILVLVGLASVVVMLCAVVPPTLDALTVLRSGRLPSVGVPARAVVAVAVVGYIAMLVVLTLLDSIVVQRHAMPILPLLAILVTSRRATERETSRDRPVAAVVALVALGVLSVVGTASNASFDAVKWSVATKALDDAGSRRLVDGGLEWNALDMGRVRYPYVNRPGTCIRVSMETAAPRGPSVVARGRVWTVGTEAWLVARRLGPCGDQS